MIIFWLDVCTDFFLNLNKFLLDPVNIHVLFFIRSKRSFCGMNKLVQDWDFSRKSLLEKRKIHVSCHNERKKKFLSPVESRQKKTWESL